MAQAAREIAQKAGNQVDLAEATLTVGKLYAVRGDREEAERCLKDSVALFERLGHMERADEGRRQLNALAEHTSPSPSRIRARSVADPGSVA